MSPHAAEQTLLQRCAMAATAGESRYRIDRPVLSTRGARIVAIDEGAATFLEGLVARGWDPQRFLTFVEARPVVDEEAGSSTDAVLLGADGVERRLSNELVGADAIVMVASQGAAAAGASLVGDLCLGGGVMTAGIVVATARDAEVDRAVGALRPNAMVLVVLEDHEEVDALLTALRV